MPADKLDKMVSAKVFSDTKDSTALECIAEWDGLQEAKMTKRRVVIIGGVGIFRQCNYDWITVSAIYQDVNAG